MGEEGARRPLKRREGGIGGFWKFEFCGPFGGGGRAGLVLVRSDRGCGFQLDPALQRFKNIIIVPEPIYSRYGYIWFNNTDLGLIGNLKIINKVFYKIK